MPGLQQQKEQFMGKKRVLVIGSSNFDLTIYCDQLPKTGETVLGGTFASSIGGKGANQATAAARMGVETAFLSAVGQDGYGDAIKTHFENEKVDAFWAPIPSGMATGVALILVDKAGQNSIAVAPGANAEMAENCFSLVDFELYSHVLISLEIPLDFAACAAMRAKAANCTVVLNPAPAALLPQKLLSHTDILIPNEHEVTELFANVTTGDLYREVAEAFFATGGSALIVTLGARGIRIVHPDSVSEIAGLSVKAVDTVGAGDCFCGAFVAALAGGNSIEAAASIANQAAAIAVQRRGAIPSFPRHEEVANLTQYV